MWVSVRVRLEVVEDPAPLEVVDDLLRDVRRLETRQPAEVGVVPPRIVDGADDRQPQRLPELVVLGAAARRDVDDAGPLVLPHFIPGDDAMLVALRVERSSDRRKLVDRPAIAPAHELAAGRLRLDREGPDERLTERALPDPEHVVALPNLDVAQVRPDGRGDVRGERPRRGGPDEQRFTLVAGLDQREPDGEARVLPILVALVHLHLRQARAATRAPGHRVVALVEPAAAVALGEEAPDEVVVLVAEREVAAAGVGHPEP